MTEQFSLVISRSFVPIWSEELLMRILKLFNSAAENYVFISHKTSQNKKSKYFDKKIQQGH
jgi:hypothetical protein